jgi:hypothetical protein
MLLIAPILAPDEGTHAHARQHARIHGLICTERRGRSAIREAIDIVTSVSMHFCG